MFIAGDKRISHPKTGDKKLVLLPQIVLRDGIQLVFTHMIIGGIQGLRERDRQTENAMSGGNKVTLSIPSQLLFIF